MAVTDLTTAWAALALCLASGERWEVVVEQEALVALAHHAVHHLLVELCAESDGSERHCLSALEDCASVRHWQWACLAPDWTHLVGLAAIHAETLVEDAAAHGVAQHVVPITACLSVLLLKVFLGEVGVGGVVLLDEVGDYLVESVVALLLRQSLVDSVVSGLVKLVVDLLAQVLVVHLVVVLALHVGAKFLCELVLEFAHWHDGLLRGLESLHKVVLLHLAHLALNHHEVVLRAADHDVEVSVLHLLESRVDDILAVNASHAAL